MSTLIQEFFRFCPKLGGPFLRAHLIGIGLWFIIAGTAFLLRHRIRPALLKLLVIVLIVGGIRVVFFYNPVAWFLYSKWVDVKSIGFFQTGLIGIELNKYLAVHAGSEPEHLIVGTSQCKAIFIYTGSPKAKLFEIPGIGSLDFLLFKDYIFANRPKTVVLFLSGVDFGREPGLSRLVNAPAQGFKLFALAWYLSQNKFLWKKPNSETQNILTVAFFSELFPEIKYSFTLRSILNRWTHYNFISGRWDSADLKNINYGTLLDYHIRDHRANLNDASYPLHRLFLQTFIDECHKRKIQVVILQGQYNPLMDNEKLISLNRRATEILKALAVQNPQTVRYVPIEQLCVLGPGDFSDGLHVTPDAAKRFIASLAKLFPDIY